MSARQSQLPSATVLTPGLTIADPSAAYWVAQVTLRLRREVAWCWRQRTGLADVGAGALPPVTDAAVENLDLVRHENERRRFFETDVTARYLTTQIVQRQQRRGQSVVRGSWEWLATTLALDEPVQFVFALGVAARLDAGLAPVFAACMNDLTRPYPTLALAQRLWDDPLAVVACADPAHALFRHGLLTMVGEPGRNLDWLQPLEVNSFTVQTLLDPDGPLPRGLHFLDGETRRSLDDAGEMLAARLNSSPMHEMHVVPLIVSKGTDYAAWVGAVAQRTNRRVARVGDEFPLERVGPLVLASLCWFRGFDVLLPLDWVHPELFHDRDFMAARRLPVRWYVPLLDHNQVRTWPTTAALPSVKINGLTFEQRVAHFMQELGAFAVGQEETIEECARRFRVQEQTIARICETYLAVSTKDADSLVNVCREEVTSELGDLAQFVTPRFADDELVLPAPQRRQFDEILHAMRALTYVHHHWGMARAWNESGLSVLFCGPPGTGKTMAAEVLSSVLQLPMYRIDLSQVVSKYIGETEKNLKRVFDAAEASDCILFFDEADALFGKRTEVKDAHDRFANIEISYLLERMERFKGLAILATNRRKDVDEAFLRRLRYIIEFNLPGEAERERIWRRVFPDAVDVSEIDFSYLAHRFQLSGGNIRSIAFNACLQAAAVSGAPRVRQTHTRGKVGMKHVLVAVKRELEKMNRVANEELFGAYGHLLQEAED